MIQCPTDGTWDTAADGSNISAPATHKKNWDRSLGPWRWPGPTLIVVQSFWEANQQMEVLSDTQTKNE